MFKLLLHSVTRMTLDAVLGNGFEPVFEIKAVFDDKEYLEQVCEQMLGKQITGYSIAENTTSYIWDNKVEKKKNYVASTIVAAQRLKDVTSYLQAEISKKWNTPLIQVLPCFVNSDFYKYTKNAVARIYLQKAKSATARI